MKIIQGVIYLRAIVAVIKRVRIVNMMDQTMRQKRGKLKRPLLLKNN
jgi:hypothetical protein